MAQTLKPYRAPAILAAATLLLVLSAFPAAAATLVNHPAPPIAGPDLSGHRISLSAERGKVVLLNFWATWCGPCRLEMPRFVEWQKQYGPLGLQIVGVSIDDTEPPVRAFAARLHLDYPVIIGDPKIGNMYGILGVPVTYLIDRSGIIRARFDGQSDLPAIQSEIRKLLAEPARFTPVAANAHR